MSWYDEPSVILSGGPVRVEVGDVDPEFKPSPVGFVQLGMSGLAAAADLERQMAKVAEVLGSSAANLERLRDAARPPIAEQDPELWGDQA